jgi:putative FmdB family regulatory protein
MPTYEYCCDACGHEFEASQRIIEPPIRTCVRCKKDAVIRKISRPSFVLKGGGWYADGYSRGGSKTKPPGNDGQSAKESTRSEGTRA